MLSWYLIGRIDWSISPRVSWIRFFSWTYTLISPDHLCFWHMICRTDLPAITAPHGRSNWDTNENRLVHSLFTACMNTYQDTHHTVKRFRTKDYNDRPFQDIPSIHWFLMLGMKRSGLKCTTSTHPLDFRPNTEPTPGSALWKQNVANPVWWAQSPSA